MLRHSRSKDYEIDVVATIYVVYRCYRISRVVAAAVLCCSSGTRARTRADKEISEIHQRSRCACRPLGWARTEAKACMDVPSQSSPSDLVDSTTTTTSSGWCSPHSLIILAVKPPLWITELFDSLPCTRRSWTRIGWSESAHLRRLKSSASILSASSTRPILR